MNNTSLAPVAAWVLITGAVCWWIMHDDEPTPVDKCRPAILHQETAAIDYEWTAYHGRCE